jgi:hypothetical protein
MDCYRHEGAPSTATCVGCQQPICADCREEVAGHPMCHPCVAAAQERLAQAPAQPPAPWLAGAAPAAGAATSTTDAPPALLAGSTAAVTHPGAANWVAAQPVELRAPGAGRRIVRGMLWGALYGQWWTLWTIISEFVWGHATVDAKFVIVAIVMAFVFGFFGSLTGLIIGASNANFRTGPAIGIGAGILLCLLEAALTKDATSMINLFFYFFTGRFVGAGITWRVQQPVR